MWGEGGLAPGTHDNCPTGSGERLENTMEAMEK